MTLNDLLDQTGRAVIKQGKRNLMDPSYQRRKASSRRSKSSPINDTGRLNRSFVYTLDESINKLTFDWVYHNNPDKDYGTFVDQGTKKINETHWFSDAYENVMLTFDAKLIQYVDDFIEEEFKSVYEEFGV